MREFVSTAFPDPTSPECRRSLDARRRRPGIDLFERRVAARLSKAPRLARSFIAQTRHAFARNISFRAWLESANISEPIREWAHLTLLERVLAGIGGTFARSSPGSLA